MYRSNDTYTRAGLTIGLNYYRPALPARRKTAWAWAWAWSQFMLATGQKRNSMLLISPLLAFSPPQKKGRIMSCHVMPFASLTRLEKNVGWCAALTA